MTIDISFGLLFSMDIKMIQWVDIKGKLACVIIWNSFWITALEYVQQEHTDCT